VDFARIHLHGCRDEALAAVKRGKDLVERERLVGEARLRLRDKLRALLAWGKESGRV
jgi:hypothetical protein